MVLALTYSLLFLVILIKYDFLKNEQFSKKFIVSLFLIKLTSIFIYTLVYSSDSVNLLFNSDTQSILHDAKIIYDSLFNKPKDFFQLIFNYNSGNSVHYLHENYFSKMEKWYLVGKSEFSLNDNQFITKVNALLMLFSFGNFYAQSVLNCILSFTGSLLMYIAFKNYFPKKEKLLLLILIFIPSVYFWTSAVLKEPILFFSLGLFIWAFFKIIINKEFTLIRSILFTVSVVLLAHLKPYVIATLITPLFIFTLIEFNILKKIITSYFTIIIVSILFTFSIIQFCYNKNIFSIIAKRQNDFVSIGYGGTFLYQNGIYMRLQYNDFSKLNLSDANLKKYKLKKGIDYMYWKYPNLKDTFFVYHNNDTLTQYELRSSVAPSYSIIEKRQLEPTISSYLKLFPKVLANAFFYPFFVNCKTTLQYLVSTENLMFILFLILSLFYKSKEKLNKNFLLFLISSVLLLFILVGYSTAIGGALVRYKVPFLPLLWMIPLLILDVEKCKVKFKFIKPLLG